MNHLIKVGNVICNLDNMTNILMSDNIIKIYFIGFMDYVYFFKEKHENLEEGKYGIQVVLNNDEWILLRNYLNRANFQFII